MSSELEERLATLREILEIWNREDRDFPEELRIRIAELERVLEKKSSVGVAKKRG